MSWETELNDNQKKKENVMTNMMIRFSTDKMAIASPLIHRHRKLPNF